MNFINTRLLTCRYWALGQCPNVDFQGIDNCPYAHYDTGILASHFDQRGTCRYWLKNRCYNGEKCFYEHRYTGTPGLYQGVVDLTGIELEIANAASRSGFNTFNHAALFDLIWSVKRIVRRNDLPRRPPPPKDAIYPDRYRPSGVGDNTKRKRVIPDATIPPFHSVAPLMRNNPGARKSIIHNQRRRNIAIDKLPNEGTRAAPICLDSGDEKPPANTSAKRLKLSNGRAVYPILQSTSHPRLGKYKVEEPSSEPGICLPASGEADTALSITSVASKLKETHTALRDHERTIEECRRGMLKEFESKADMYYKNEEVMSTIKALAKGIFQAADGLTQAIKETDALIRWINNTADERDKIL